MMKELTLQGRYSVETSDAACGCVDATPEAFCTQSRYDYVAHVEVHVETGVAS